MIRNSKGKYGVITCSIHAMRDDQIILDWRDVNHESGRWADRWDYTLALYGILHPTDDKVIYLGKADGPTSTVRRRWNADEKHDRVWRRMEASEVSLSTASSLESSGCLPVSDSHGSWYATSRAF